MKKKKPYLEGYELFYQFLSPTWEKVFLFQDWIFRFQDY